MTFLIFLAGTARAGIVATYFVAAPNHLLHGLLLPSAGHANLLGEANAVFAVLSIGPDDAVLGILPMFHVLAQMANLMLPLVNGARVVYLETLNTTELLRALQERDITVFAVVPQFFYLIHEKIFKEVAKRGKIAQTLLRGMSPSRTEFISSIVGTRGSFFGSLGVATSLAGFCSTTPSCASHR